MARARRSRGAVGLRSAKEMGNLPVRPTSPPMNRPLDSRQLLAFVTVVRCQSFTRAAKELHLTQSAISHSMRALERDVGCRLLERKGRRMELTEPGGHFLQKADQILREMEQARAELDNAEPLSRVASVA